MDTWNTQNLTRADTYRVYVKFDTWRDGVWRKMAEVAPSANDSIYTG